ncbi:MAG: c-type cytochrome [Sulfurimonadaceae bacterium]|nr:c-type cytochrome [Sulfurimonadaceae bacterium]
MSHDPVISAALFALLFTPAVTVALVFACYGLIMKRKPMSLSAATAPLVITVLFALLWLLFSRFDTAAPERTTITVAGDAELTKMGKSLFDVHCSICHGVDGRAPDAKGADLTHRISFESALLNIQRGANNFKYTYPGGMPPMISDTMRAAQIAHYVSSGFTENEEGKKLYGMLGCVRCHGDDGRGRAYLGPNIREFDLQTVALVVKNGKKGVIGNMPKFDHFSEEQVKALGLYVLSLHAEHNGSKTPGQ